MAASNAGESGGAGWPDVALAIVAFAREDTWEFLLVLVVLTLLVWFLFPRATAMLRESYRSARARRREAVPAVEDREND